MTDQRQHGSFTLLAQGRESTASDASATSTTTPTEPEIETGSRDMLVAGGILLVLIVAFVFAKQAYANWLVGKKVSPRSANTAGWWLFILLASLATVAVLGAVNYARFLTVIVLAPLGLVALLSLALLMVSSRR